METGEKSTSPETLKEYPFDAVVLLCGGVERTSSDQWRPNFESKLKIAAAAEIHRQGLTPVIISSGGPLWGAPPLGELMADSLTKKFRVPSQAVIVENRSTDTSAQVEYSLKIIRDKGFQQVAVLADSEHVKRAAELFSNYGFAVSPLSAEDYLLQRSPHYKRVVKKLQGSPYWKYWKVRETLLRALLMVDKRQTFFRDVTKFIRTKATKLRLPGTGR